MSFRIVKDSPGWPPAARRRLATQNAFRPYASDSAIQVADLEEKHRLIRRGLILRAFAFQANEPSTAIELCVMARLLILQVQSQVVAIKFLRRLKIVKVQLNARKSEPTI